MSDGTKLIGVIGDEDTVTGFILAGIGHRTAEGTNFLVVKPCAFVAEEIRHLLNTYEKTIPTVLEIPSKDSPYDPTKDYIMKRVNLMLGES
ncbi:hypothetical protein BBJ28_00003628 [Nothophytophthora sp. Chile5]|nr:hypothetical protein BBJ28_00003628 [Nothophytophthora sp. Chile5]